MYAQLYIYFIALQMLAVAISCYGSFRIAQTLLTPTFTWALLGFGFFFRLVVYVHSLFYVKDIVDFFGGYDHWLIVAAHIMEALITALFFAFVARSYFALRNKGLLKK
jgi:hypothetical protein